MKYLAVALLLVPFVTLSACQTTQDGSWLEQTQDVIAQTLNLPGGETTLGELSNSDMIVGLREALSVGTGTVVKQLGVRDGFNLDPQIRIPLPRQLERVDSALGNIGMNSLTQDLELRLNRAAEMATPRAKELFINAISQMTITDAQEILYGGQNDAATQYLRRTMGVELGQDMTPIVGKALSDAGAIRAYDSVMGQYQNLPFMPDVKADLNQYVVDKALDGIFYYVAAEEAAIRENPAKRTTDILKRVFGTLN
ncbi:MAG: DUF4197 domain-containing protein [Pseudomonadota bacterium]